jgi:hypothetical protein
LRLDTAAADVRQADLTIRVRRLRWRARGGISPGVEQDVVGRGDDVPVDYAAHVLRHVDRPNLAGALEDGHELTAAL